MTRISGAVQPPLSGRVPARRPDPPEEGPVPFYKRLWRWWLPRSGRIAAVQNRLLSTLAFWVGLTPVALWMRWTKQDRLDRTTRPVGASGWNAPEGPIHTDPDRIRRPF